MEFLSPGFWRMYQKSASIRRLPVPASRGDLLGGTGHLVVAFGAQEERVPA